MDYRLDQDRGTHLEARLRRFLAKTSAGSIRRVIISGCKIDQQIHTPPDVG